MAMAANDSETEIHDQSTSSSQQNPGLFQLNAIIEGLRIREGQTIIAYSYGYTGDARPVDWKVIAANEEAIQGEHIRCLPLKDGKDMDQLVGHFQTIRAKAVVFVNTRDDFMVEAQHWPKLGSIPVILLKSSDGNKLLSIVDTSQVFGKVVVESSVDADAVTTKKKPTAALQPPKQSTERGKETKPDSRPSIKDTLMQLLPFGDKHDLNTTIKQLMFNNDNPVIVSEDSGVFTVVMSTFQQYEQAGKGDGNHGDLLKKLVKCLNSNMLERDFPFYIILAHRIRLNPIYKCANGNLFLSTLIEKMESLDPVKLSATLAAFMKSAANVQVDDSTAISLLEAACLNLAIMSSKRLPENHIYRRMVWVSIALKCHSVGGRKADEIWDKYLVQMVRAFKFKFIPSTIEDLRRGLSLTKSLRIPSTAMMSAKEIIELVGVESSVRPLSHLMNFLDCIAGFTSNIDGLAHLSTAMRAQYQSWISHDQPIMLQALSIEGTVAGAIQEGINFVEKLREIINQNNLYISEEEGWLTILLQLVDVTKPGADEHLKKFLSKGNSQVVKIHREHLIKKVTETIRQSFPLLPIYLFFPLFKHWTIWPPEFVEDYLTTYKMLPGMRICDGTWIEFIGEVTERFSRADEHHFLLDFFKKVGCHYVMDGRPHEFILDLLGMNVPKLFGHPADTNDVPKNVQTEFLSFLIDYIHSNALKSGLFQKMSKILSDLSEQFSEFQLLILTVLKKEVVPEIRTLQSCDASAQEVLAIASTRLQKDLSWIQALNHQQTFCWSIVATCCSNTSSSITTDWVHSNRIIISQLGKIYASYCNGKNILQSDRILAGTLPKDIAQINSDDVTAYFEWVRRLQMVLTDWQRKLLESDVNYDDIRQYNPSQAKLFQIEQLVHSADCEYIEKSYLEAFEKVNAHFIKYIPGNPDAKYCFLPQILHQYGVLFPFQFKQHLMFPGDKAPPDGEMLLLNPASPRPTSTFQPPGKVALVGTKALTVKVLTELAEQLDQFIKPILDHMHMLVFFSLHQSKIFHLQMGQVLEQPISARKAASSVHPSTRHSSTLPSLPMLTTPREEGPIKEGVSLQTLAKALAATQNFIIRLIEGTVKYSEIIAEGGELKLESINIEAEFNVLKGFCASVELAPHIKSYEGLNGISCMLELFQYASVHIPAIHHVCTQYTLKDCLNDPILSDLMKFAKEVEGSKANITPSETVKKISDVKASLCLNDKPGAHHNLGLFKAVANSAAFYQFIKANKFDGENGQAAFDQQYQLITAQLQHEEYNENVLNHLIAAYKFILPFMDTKQSFGTLMKKVTSLNVSGGLSQLETVNSNITLISLWFSRAEGDTLQNVAKDLDCIIQTGHYQFEFTSNEGIMMTLEYCPQAALPAQSSSLGNGSKPNDKEGPGGKERWSKEQIDDFVRKLGFLDAEKEGGDKIKHFLTLNEVTNNMLKLHIQLRDLGCADFSNEMNVSCSTTKANDAVSLVKKIETQLSERKHELSKLCDENDWMLFFQTPKLLLMYKELSEWMSLSCLLGAKNLHDMKEKIVVIKRETKLCELKNELGAILVQQDVSDSEKFQLLQNVCKALHVRASAQAVRHIVMEISFLCKNDPVELDVMKNKVEVILNELQHNLTTCQPPMSAVSVFLAALLNHSLQIHLKTVVNRSLSTCTSTVPIGPGTSQILLHSCPGFTQRELIPLILNIFGGVLEPFQVFRCQASTTQEKLALFLKRAAKFQIPHLIVEVNKLPFHLQEDLMQFHLEMKHGQLGQVFTYPCLQYIETKPSNLRDMPWVTLKEHKVEPVSMIVPRDKLPQSLVHLVYGNAGDGKSHYIKGQLHASPSCCTIAVNEAFTPLGAIRKLRSLPSSQQGCAIFFNFTLLPPSGKSVQLHYISESPEDEDKQSGMHIPYCRLMEVIGWFFFDLLILGYVEDMDTGLSFHLPGGPGWHVYVEVPSRDINMTCDETLEQFFGDIPTLGLLGSPHLVSNDAPYIIDKEVQLVCKYLKAYKEKRIDELYNNIRGRLVKFSTDPDVADDECHRLLNEFMADHIKARKITQHLFIKYFSIRCHFLDNLPAFNYNSGVGEYKLNEKKEYVPTNTQRLGSSLIATMLKEVSDFCDPSIKENWSLNPHQQLIYDIKDGGASFDLISLHADKISLDEREKFTKIGVNVPSMMMMHSRELLDKYLSRALNIELKDGHLKPIDDSGYVLTLDYTLKMLNIHERYRCGVPVIIEGETGVGKTALVQMLSVLWNHSLLNNWIKEKGRIHNALRRRIGDLSEDSYESYERCVQLITELSEDKLVTIEDMLLLCHLPGSTNPADVLYLHLRKYLLGMRHLPVVKLLATKEVDDMSTLFQKVEEKNTAEATAELLRAVYAAQLKPTFYKVNVHAALTQHEIKEFLKPAFDQARELQLQPNTKCLSEIPFVTVFLDEVNTSSCLGLLKEVIVDRTFDGEPIPKNLFVVAACNPHRGNSMVSHKQDWWPSSSYYVRPLHPTLQLIMWDYGSLDCAQERDYINAKMKMVHRSMSDAEVASLTKLILDSQEAMRSYAKEQLRAHNISLEEAIVASHSSVSQRDIQRVFTLHEWLMKGYEKSKPYGDRTDYHSRALWVALGIVYYMRLTAAYRKAYSDLMDKACRLSGEVIFSQAFEDELKWYIDRVDLSLGIAKTQALKENIFATIICTVTRTPLIIVGAPGSSKTLSFNVTVANLKGQESKVKTFRETDQYPSLDSHYYQCSRRTTSNEIQTIFTRAINRQRSHLKNSLPIHCVVFMDEAGLPKESHESLKVLHYYLDNPVVSFVAITNHVLDAAKTNRAISLFRPESSGDDLETLAKGCLYSEPGKPPAELNIDLVTITKFCQPYQNLMVGKDAKQFFGLRDFIHFVNYLRKRRHSILTAQVVLEALERNFNGSDEFEDICRQFLTTLHSHLDVNVKHRQILDILRDSLADRPNEANRTENEVRYKLIIDPSEDDSLVRLLFTFGVLDRQNTRVFVCSDFPGDTHIQKINTIAAICHSAIEGHTVVMAQTDDIHESFYDLFNQRFRRIDDQDRGPRYYANIAIGAHSKPCRVHPEFQCVVVVKKSEVKNMPAPFLNRFEKYRLTHHALLEAALGMLPPCIAVVVKTVREKINEFVGSVGGKESFYGLKEETTVDSLFLSVLPTEKHTYKAYEPNHDPKADHGIEVACLQELITAFRTSAGFHISTCSLEELILDADHVSNYVCADPELKGLLQNLTPQGVGPAVAQAMQKLHEAPPPQGSNSNVGLSREGCAMVAMAIQWLIRYLCKRLMQLMTPEALTIHRMGISSSYLVNYLRHHFHFSLKGLVNDRLNTLKDEDVKMYCPTKLLCYTRNSSLVRKLPLSYSGSGNVVMGMEETHQAIKDLVLDDVDAVVVHELSKKSQNSFRELLKTFAGSKCLQVLLLVANMAEVTLPMVNHLRIMIEEAENIYQRQSHLPKLFVLLLHFPTHNFLNPCYPTLYLRGWDHYYLDTIGQHIGNGVIDVKDWFSHCCFHQDKNSNISGEEDSLVQTVKGFLEEAILIISSRVPFSSFAGFPLNGKLTISERGSLLRELLITKGVGVVLCKLFRFYWKPSMISSYLEQAACLAHKHQSTLNITDTIQAAFKVTFMDFMAVMVSRLNENCNIDGVFVDGGSPAVDAVFRDLLAVYPCPLLTQLKVLSNNLQAPCNPGYVPVFPFFNMVMTHMDQLIEQCRRDTNEDANVLKTIAMVPSSQLHDKKAEFENLRARMLCALKASAPNECVFICVQSVANKPELWPRYLSNFIFSKLHLASPESTIEKQIIQEVFHDLPIETTEAIVYLHAYMAVYQLDIANVATILRSLALLEKIKATSLLPPASSSAKQSLHSIHQSAGAYSTQNLSTFVISVLFKALLGCLNAGEQLKLWYRAYLDIMTLPSLADIISEGLATAKDIELRAQSNVMQATFAVLQCKPDCDSEVLDVGLKLFFTLFSRYFKENGKLKDKCPHLAEVYQAVVECLKATPTNEAQVHRTIERILSHFFPVNSTRSSPEDCHWFLEYTNSQRQLFSCTAKQDPDKLTLEELSQNVDLQMTIHIFKLYLSCMLGEQQNGESSYLQGPLTLYNDKRRALVGEVLMAASDLGPPAQYIPLFYQRSMFIIPERGVISARMQQPLAHLYFLVVMEHLSSKQYTLPNLLRAHQAITKRCALATTSDQEKVILFIEQQATVQVIVQQAAIYLDPSEPQNISQLGNIRRDVNSVLDDPSMGGGAYKGHTLVLALHLLKHLKSFRKFTELLTVNFDTVCQGITCLKQFCGELKEKEEPKPHLFPCMVQDTGSLLESTYHHVHTTMLAIHKGSGSIDDLIKIAQESTTSQTGVDAKGAFRMAVWLTVYYDFFNKKEKSELLCNAIGGDKMSCFFEKGHLALIQRFLNPDLMLSKPELPNPLREDEEVLVLQQGGRQTLKQRKGNKEDPLIELFRPSENQPLDQSDADLRHALANMVAVVMASPKASNHLWYHLFAPGDLVDTYMTGFMYDTKVKPDGLHYDCGVELSPDGQFGRQDYLKHAGRGTYTLHSLYLLLWANFGAFCVGLLTQPDAQKQLHGTIISNWLSIRHYCVSQLRTIWLYMRNNLNISDEERSFFLTRCMMKFYEVAANPHSSANMQQGRFLTREELDSYERMWHTQIYQPSWSELKHAFTQYCQEWQNTVFLTIRTLGEQYPQLPTEKDFIHNLLSFGDISLQKQGGGLSMLTQFVLERPKLLAGGRLLRDLVEFYLWLHTQLAYIVSYEMATELKIGQVVERAVERYSKDFGKHIKDLYERVKVGYNAYVDTIGHAIGAGACVAVRRGNKVYTIADDMPLLHFLSDTPEEEEGNDWLYAVMADIVNTHNSFIEGLYTMTRSQSSPMDHLLPSEPSKIPLTEFILSHCIVGRKNCLHDVDDFLQLVRSRCLPQGTQDGTSTAERNPSTSTSTSTVQQFNFYLLQEDVVTTYLVGKPLLESASSIRTHFKFRNIAQQSSPHPTDVASSSGDIESFHNQLPDSLKVPCDDSTVKIMEFEFHSASYLTLLEAILIMKNVLGHLMKEGKELGTVNTQTIREFMATLDTQIDQDMPVFPKACIPTLSPAQLKFLEALPTAMVFSCLKLFIQWLKDGMYDFHTLPFALKTHLSPNEQETLHQIPTKWNGDIKKLLNELKGLTDSLVHSEAYFTKNTNDILRIPIVKYLEDFHFLSHDDRLPTFIPHTICVQHYVAFRVALRSLVVTVQLCVTDDDMVGKGVRWQEFVGDIWSKRLHHFRNSSGDGGMSSNPVTIRYGFDESEGEDKKPLHDVLADDAAAASLRPENHAKDELENAEHTNDSKVVNSMADTNTAASVNNCHAVQEETSELEQLALSYSCDDVAKFLQSMGLDQYIDTFQTETIDGELLVAFKDIELRDLGVSNPLHCFKIQYFFKRLLLKTPTTHAQVVVCDFLAANKMDKYAQKLIEEGVDGDMLLEILKLSTDVITTIFGELGITKHVDVLKIRKKFKQKDLSSSCKY